MTPALGMFLGFVLLTLVITYWAARRSQGASAYFAAGRRITGWQNGLAVAGDYMSAASFLGIAGMIAFNGYDGFMYSVGLLVAYLTVLLIVAEPLRNAGKYTMADVLAYRLSPRPVRAMASLSTLTVSTFYMIAQMVGAGALVKLLLPGVQLRDRRHRRRRADDRLCGLRRHARDDLGADHQGDPAHERHDFSQRCWCMKHFDFSFAQFFDAISARHVRRHRRRDGHAEFSRARACCFKTNPGAARSHLARPRAGLRHRRAAAHPRPLLHRAGCEDGARFRRLGDGHHRRLLHHDDVPRLRRGDDSRRPDQHRATAEQHGRAAARPSARRRSLLRLHQRRRLRHDPRGGRRPDDQREHSLRARFLHQRHPPRQRASPGEEVRVARITAFVVGAVSIFLAIQLQTINVAFLVGLAFAVAASANLPVIVLSIFWRRFNTAGAVAGLAVGLVSSHRADHSQPEHHGTRSAKALDPWRAALPAAQPRHRQHPARLPRRDHRHAPHPRARAEAQFAELTVRANTGLGAEKATAH